MSRLYTRVYSGYGESLIDYNFNQTRVGVGVMLNDIFPDWLCLNIAVSLAGAENSACFEL